MKFDIVYLSGKMGTGKDTIANYLVCNYGFNKYAFADRLKKICREDCGWNGEKDKKGRKLLQDIGNTAREFNKNFWISQLVNTIKQQVTQCCNDKSNKSFKIVISDCRFENEIENFSILLTNEIKNSEINNEIKIRIIGKDFANRDKNNELENNESEISLDNYNKFDYYIVNDEGLKELKNKIDLIMKSHNYTKKNYVSDYLNKLY